MPTLPTKMDLGSPGSQGRSLALAPENWPDDTLMPVAKAVADSGTKIAATLETKQHEADDYEVQKRIIDFDLEQEKRLDDAKRNAPPEAKGFTDSYRAGYDQGATKLMQSIPDRLKPKVDEMLVKRGASFEKRAYDFELAERDRWNIQDVNKNTSDLVTRTMGNPDSLEDNAARGVALIRSSKLSQRAKIDTERKFLDMNAEYGIKSLIDREIEAGRDAGDLIKRLRSVPRGTVSAVAADAGNGIDLTTTLTSGKGNGAPAGWARSNETWASLDPFQKAAAMALMEADGRDPVAAKNALGAMINRAAKGGEDLGEHVSQKIYQPTIEPSQERRLGSIVESDQFQQLTQWAKDRAAGKAPDPVGGNTHFLAHEKTMEGLTAREPGKYRSWKGWSGYDRGKGVYTNPDGSEVIRDNSHAFLSPEGRYEARATLTKGSDTVERKDLPAPGEVATDESGPKLTVDENGNPTVSKDITDTKGDIPPKAEPGTPSEDELVESDAPGWHYLSPQVRRKLINYARTAGRAVATKAVDDDIARLRLGKEPEAGPDGKLSIDRARSSMTNMQWTKKRQEWDAAKLEHQETSDLRGMTDAEMADYTGSIVDRAEAAGLSVADAARIQKKATTMVGKIIEMRNKDPVRAITGSIGDEPDDRTPPLPHVAEAMQILRDNRARRVDTGPDGAPVVLQGAPGRAPRVSDPDQAPEPFLGGKAPMSGRDQWGLMFAARLKDQQTVMPFDPEKHRIISKTEAEQLLMIPKNGKDLGDSRQFRKMLEAGWERAQKKFPPEFADRAFKEAVNFAVQGDVDGVKAGILAKVAKGRPVTNMDLRQLQQIEDIDSTSLIANIDNQARLVNQGASQFSDMMTRVDRAGRDVGAPNVVPPPVNSGSPAIRGDRPNAQQIEWLNKNPDAWETFDRMFGAGAAAKALGTASDQPTPGVSGSDPWGKDRGKVAKREWREDEKSMKPKGWMGFFGR